LFVLSGKSVYYIQINYKPVINDAFNPQTPLHNEIYYDRYSFNVLKMHRTVKRNKMFVFEFVLKIV